MGKKVHENYITIAKAIGIILMVIGHSGCPVLLYKFIYLFHMPLFFLCSGLLFKDILNEKEAFLYLKKKIVGLYIPFVKWSLIFLVLHNIFLMIGIYNPVYGYEGGSSFYSISEMLKRLVLIVISMRGYEELLGGFWFIRSLFVSTVLITFVSLLLDNRLRYKNESMCLLFLLITIIMRRFASDIEIGRELSMGTMGATFFMMGRCIIPYVHFLKTKCVAIISGLVLLFSMIYFKEVVKMECGFNKVIPYSIAAISGSLLTLYVSSVLNNKKHAVRSALYYVGNHTLTILALHFICFRMVSFMIVMISNIDSAYVAQHPVIHGISLSGNSYWWLLYSAIGICVPLLLNNILRRIVTK
ncbi:acyltransferase family protein [Xylanibacter brevis]|uniref:acyltransferase family protein n=1 Tax=Xylanibacter brevis TaxID=83231 RepID=UPI0006942BE8|nr:acyltransferase family protein [Xylanibacter brevis]